MSLVACSFLEHRTPSVCLGFLDDRALMWHFVVATMICSQIKEVKVRPVGSTHSGCGVDGELLDGERGAEWQCSLLPAQGRLLGQDPGAFN